MEIDSILEEDLIEALGSLDNNNIIQEKPKNIEQQPVDKLDNNKNRERLDMSASDVAILLKELLNDKSLEITIRLKEN